MNKSFKALIVEDKGSAFTRSIKERSVEDLPENDVLIEVHYSALNYKDALSATGNKGVTRNYPHTPGVDAAGIVAKSEDNRFQKGDEVVVTGYKLGMDTAGGFGEYICVPGDWIVPLPQGLSLKESMMIGTAGFTAAYGVYKILGNEKLSTLSTSPDYAKASSGKPSNYARSISQNSFAPSKGDKKALITGATGGVGSFGVSILNKVGFEVIAATGKEDQKNYLKQIGASEVIGRDEVYQSSDRPLLSRRWNVALETVGGEMLDAVIRQTALDGSVACCGNILGDDFKTSIYPFILRGVNLLGINSASCSMPVRQKIWNKLAGDWKPETLDTICRECLLEELNSEIDRILEGGQVGKVLLVHNQ